MKEMWHERLSLGSRFCAYKGVCVRCGGVATLGVVASPIHYDCFLYVRAAIALNSTTKMPSAAKLCHISIKVVPFK